MRRQVQAVAAALGLQAIATLAQPMPMDATQLQRIVALGPWPVLMGPDPGNKVSGRPDAVEFGYRMFRESRLSANGYVTCMACHQTDRAFTDGIARAHALAPLPRNTPALANLRLQRRYGWDGASESLWRASLRPMLDAREFGADATRIAHVVRIGDGLACRYQRSFGAAPAAHSDQTVMRNVALALAAFVETLTTGRTAFDDYRDALARGDWLAAANYPDAARRGAALFVGQGGCAGCHAGPNLSDGRLHDAGVAAGAAPAVRGRLRTPALRNIAVTPPYLHDGSADTLGEAAAHAGGELSAAQIDDLVAFLRTLTDAQGAARSIPPLIRSPCS